MTSVQLPLDLGHRASVEAWDFVPAPCNRVALGWLDRYPDWPGPAVVLFGPEGCGKSHLARIFAGRTGAQVLNPDALPEPAALPRRSAWVLDPAEPVRREVALLQLYNGLREAGGHLLLTGRCPPADWAIRLPDLASRLRASPAVEIGPPDDTLLEAVLVKLFSDRQLKVAGDMIAYMVSRMERSFAAAHRIVQALDARALERQRPITIGLVREALQATGKDED